MQFLQLHEPGETPLPHADDSAVAVGIDLGTTHSVVAYARAGQVEILKNTHGHTLTPSVVEYAGAEPVVGYAAREALARGSATAVASIKRRMHRAAEPLTINGVARSPVEISADILRALKAHAERALGQNVNQAVITVPAYFDDAARTATRDAARLAGLTVLRLISEPTAAALAYGLETGAEGLYAVYDLGGGTFDFSLLALEKGVFRVLATGGDTQLGGDDVDALLAAHAGVSLSDARAAKETLSNTPSLTLPLPGGEEITVSRATLEALTTPLLERTLTIVSGVLADAGRTVQDVKGVVLVGGATRMPLLRQRLADVFGAPPLTDVNPDEVVAAGAALQAEALTHASDHVLLDVIPLSLGVETMGGLTEKLIPRNTPIPISVAQEFTTWQDGQTGMHIHVTQGEREMAEHNRSLARFVLSGIPPLPAGIARVKITYTVDADGLLSVTASEATTGTTQHVEVKPTYGLAPEDMERMLRDSMHHAKDDITHRLLVEAQVEAKRAVVELESALKADGDLLQEAARTLLHKQMGYVQEAIESADRDRIDVEVHQLAQLAGPFAEARMNRAIEKALRGKSITEM